MLTVAVTGPTGEIGKPFLAALLDSLGALDPVSVAPCAAVAERVLADPDEFAGATALDPRSWAG